MKGRAFWVLSIVYCAGGSEAGKKSGGGDRFCEGEMRGTLQPATMRRGSNVYFGERVRWRTQKGSGL